MAKRFKRFTQWIARRAILFTAILLISTCTLMFWFIATGFSQTESRLALGIAAVTTFFAAISSIANLLSAVEIQRQRENQERPFILAYFDIENSGVICFKIQNFGNSPAMNIKVKFDPSPIDLWGRSLNDVSLFAKPIDFLPPGKSMRQVVNVGHKMLAKENNTLFSFTVEYMSIKNELYKDSTNTDLSYLSQAHLPEKSIEEGIDSISKSINKLVSAFDKVYGFNSLLVETPKEYQARLRRKVEGSDEEITWKIYFRKLLEYLLSKL